jgi:hypothetical protein
VDVSTFALPALPRYETKAFRTDAAVHRSVPWIVGTPCAFRSAAISTRDNPLAEHHVDPRAPFVITSIAEPMTQPHVVRREVPAVHLQPRVVVGRRRPVGAGRHRIERPATPMAVALGHLAAHVDDLAVSRELPEDPANAERLELRDG